MRSCGLAPWSFRRSSSCRRAPRARPSLRSEAARPEERKPSWRSSKRSISRRRPTSSAISWAGSISVEGGAHHGLCAVHVTIGALADATSRARCTSAPCRVMTACARGASGRSCAIGCCTQRDVGPRPQEAVVGAGRRDARRVARRSGRGETTLPRPRRAARRWRSSRATYEKQKAADDDAKKQGREAGAGSLRCAVRGVLLRRREEPGSRTKRSSARWSCRRGNMTSSWV